jgi:outer membrane autotransporter protein
VNLIGTVGYTLGKNEIKHLGYKGKPDVNTFSLGIRAEKAHKITENFAVTPHIGIRYMNVDMDSFTAGGFKYSAKKVNYAEVPFGVSVNGEAKAQCGAVVKPYADFTLAPALGTKKARNSFGLAGSAASDSFSARVANSNLYRGAIGLEATRANHSLGLSYGIDAGSDGRVDQNLQARYRYSF